MQTDLVSIIIPVYNAAKFINDTVNSILNQTYKNFEAIFIDDCSNDNSVELIEKYKDNRIKIIRNKVNLGAAISRNNGIQQAEGRYICFLDADDFWKPNKIEAQIQFMKEKNCAFSFTNYEFADENGKPKGIIVNVPNRITYRQALKNTTISTNTVMFDTKIIKKDIIYMPNVKSEDTACWWNILKQIDYAYGLNENLSYYRRSSGTLSSNKFEAIRRIWYLYRKVEKLNIIYATYCFIFYAVNAVRRRI